MLGTYWLSADMERAKSEGWGRNDLGFIVPKSARFDSHYAAAAHVVKEAYTSDWHREVYLGSPWLVYDYTEAAKEGWPLWARPRAMIEPIHIINRPKITTETLMKIVLAKAKEGSLLHIKAMKIFTAARLINGVT
jgi:hypothetical protein